MADDRPVLRPVDFDPFGAPPAPERWALTEPQAEMWTAAAMGAEANCAYNQCFALTLDGPLRVDSLGAALKQLVARHEALRVVISEDGSGQALRPPFEVPLPLEDLSAIDPAARQSRIAALLERESTTPFDLAEGPLIRALVVRESAHRHLFVVTAHHIVCDGWSSTVLFSDLGQLYAADRVGIPAQLPPAASYRDFLASHAGPDERAAAAGDEDYWAAQYATGSPTLELPLVRPRPAVKTYRSAREELRLDGDLYFALKRTAAQSGATLFAALLTAYEALLYRLSGQTDFVIGVPFAGQPRLEDPALVAHCVSTVPVRVRLDPAQPFADQMRLVNEQLVDSLEHSRLTFGSLVRRLRLPRDLSRTPLVATTFTIDKLGAPFDFGDVTIAGVATPKAYANFEVAVNVVDSGSEMVVECDYNTDLFDASTLRRWLAHYEAMLRGIAADPGAALHALPLGVDEGAVSGVSVGVVGGGGGCVHERFEGWVRRAPGRVAVVCGDVRLSYGELDGRANALAWRLRGLGVGPGTLVGLRVARSVDVVVGIVGVLKAGGAYVPLDPAYPADRVAFMVGDSQVGVVVAGEEFVGDFGVGVDVVVVDDGRLGVAEGAPRSGVSLDDLAYVMYTSGSTGAPKGVMVSHRNVGRLFDATQGWFGFGSDDVWSLFHSYAFDFSVWELWGALVFGGRVVVVPYWVSRSPEAFWGLVVDEQVTVLSQTPSAFRQLMLAEADSGRWAESLRWVVFGGEALEFGSLAPWMERHGDQRPQLVNMYGITETTVHVTYRPVRWADVRAGVGSVIGVPLPDLQVWVLDGHGQPVPMGVAGEMVVGGAGVTGGYWRRPELTAERFVVDRFGGGGRVYRSGDLARRLESGELEYLGRIDDQVKIRGFRIELGEIEAVLAGHPWVREAAVVVREDRAGDKRLVGYVVGDGGGDGWLDQVKTYLKAKLPDYMVPAHLVELARLPLTANGKTDRNALPAPEVQPAAHARPHQPPRTPTEERIATIWAAALGIAAPGVLDDFFDLGGHSLMAAQVVTAVRSELGVDVAMRHLFEQPTIEGLARIVDVIAVSPAGGQSAAGVDREEIEL